MLRHRSLELVGAGLFGALLGAVAVLVFADQRTQSPPSPVLVTGIGLLLGALFIAAALIAQRKRGTGQEVVRRALRTGRLPEDVDDGTMRRLLQQRWERLLTARWGWPALAALQVLVGVLRLLDADSGPYARVGWALVVALWIAFGIGSVWIARRDAPRTARLLDELDARAVVADQERSASS